MQAWCFLMDGAAQARGGADNRRRRRLNPRDDGRDVAQHVHQKPFEDGNTNRDEKGPSLIDITKKLLSSGLVDPKHFKGRFENLPPWSEYQTPQVQNHYKGMRTVMRRLHLNRCRFLLHLVENRGGSNECDVIEMLNGQAVKELCAMQDKIKELGGRAWDIPSSFSLPLTLNKKDGRKD